MFYLCLYSFCFNLNDVNDYEESSTFLQKEPVPETGHSDSLHQYSEEQGLISLSTFSQMEELIHRRMIWSIRQSLHPSCVHS